METEELGCFYLQYAVVVVVMGQDCQAVIIRGDRSADKKRGGGQAKEGEGRRNRGIKDGWEFEKRD